MCSDCIRELVGACAVVVRTRACLAEYHYTGDRSGMDMKDSRDVTASSKDASNVTGASINTDDSASACRVIAARKMTILPDFFTGGPDQQWLRWLDDFDLHADVNGWITAS